MNKVQAEEGADRLDDHLDTFFGNHPGLEEHLAGKRKLRVKVTPCFAVQPSRIRHNQNSRVSELPTGPPHAWLRTHP